MARSAVAIHVSIVASPVAVCVPLKRREPTKPPSTDRVKVRLFPTQICTRSFLWAFGFRMPVARFYRAAIGNLRAFALGSSPDSAEVLPVLGLKTGLNAKNLYCVLQTMGYE